MVIKPQFDLHEAIVAIWVIDNWQANESTAVSACPRWILIWSSSFVCLSHWEAFHTCALTALSDCQEEASSIWETLREDSRKIRFQGSLFDLCSPSSSPSLRLHLAALSLPLLAVLMIIGSYWSTVWAGRGGEGSGFCPPEHSWNLMSQIKVGTMF